MASLLPRKPQPILKHQILRDHTNADMAAHVDGKSIQRYRNLANGRAFVSPDESRSIEAFIGLPIQVLFDKESLAYINGPWPPRRGAGALRDRLDVAEGELEDLRSKVVPPDADTTGKKLVAIPDEYVDAVVAFIRQGRK